VVEAGLTRYVRAHDAGDLAGIEGRPGLRGGGVANGRGGSGSTASGGAHNVVLGLNLTSTGLLRSTSRRDGGPGIRSSSRSSGNCGRGAVIARTPGIGVGATSDKSSDLRAREDVVAARVIEVRVQDARVGIAVGTGEGDKVTRCWPSVLVAADLQLDTCRVELRSTGTLGKLESDNLVTHEVVSRGEI